jgi:flagellar biosynthesis chaperone FliJ
MSQIKEFENKIQHLSTYQLELAQSMMPKKEKGIFRDESDLNACFK